VHDKYLGVVSGSLVLWLLPTRVWWSDFFVLRGHGVCLSTLPGSDWCVVLVRRVYVPVKDWRCTTVRGIPVV
jgi:hypothetical protein